MPLADKVAIQRTVVDSLIAQGRRPFRGSLALNVSFRTTGRDPTHLPQLGKNLMDLLARRLPGLGRGPGVVLYYDDQQIDALSVTCRHEGPPPKDDPDDEAGSFREWGDGPTGPRIALSAVRHSLFLEDLAAGAEAERVLVDMDQRCGEEKSLKVSLMEH